MLGRPSGARWAQGGELGALRGRRDGPGEGRLVLGRHHGRLLRAEARHALVAFGPPQSGKSAGLAVPALLEWDGPAVASSIKTDLLAATERRRRALGEVFVFDPFGLAGGWRAHLVAAARLAHVGRRTGDGVAAGRSRGA